jgi:hypothetical protein
MRWETRKHVVGGAKNTPVASRNEFSTTIVQTVIVIKARLGQCTDIFLLLYSKPKLYNTCDFAVCAKCSIGADYLSAPARILDENFANAHCAGVWLELTTINSFGHIYLK